MVMIKQRVEFTSEQGDLVYSLSSLGADPLNVIRTLYSNAPNYIMKDVDGTELWEHKGKIVEVAPDKRITLDGIVKNDSHSANAATADEVDKMVAEHKPKGSPWQPGID
ncbi:MAG TPA: hypothetical protein VJI97_01370 [Candidatus Nanoarchaeia archaeon]|nr:hypothetical protein [Candidatus Nanoarchaeia archaeon]